MSALLEITSQAMVQADQERVWQAVVDWPRQREWIWATRVRGAPHRPARPRRRPVRGRTSDRQPPLRLHVDGAARAAAVPGGPRGAGRRAPPRPDRARLLIAPFRPP